MLQRDNTEPRSVCTAAPIFRGLHAIRRLQADIPRFLSRCGVKREAFAQQYFGPAIAHEAVEGGNALETVALVEPYSSGIEV